VQSGQPLVAGCGDVAPVVLKMTQECHDPVEGQVGEGQPVILQPLSAAMNTRRSRMVSR